jgi:hypothetical protein
VVAKPGHQRKVVGQAPEAGHRKVAVDVHQARHHDAARGVDDLAGRHGTGKGRGPLLNKEDLSVADPDDRVIQDPTGRRHRQKRTAGDQDVGFLIIGVHRKSPLEIRGRFAQYTVKFH